MIQLGIVLGAYKAGGAVTYVFVYWIMTAVGFQLMLPLIIVASTFLLIYARSSYIDCYNPRDGQITLGAVTISPQDSVEVIDNLVSRSSRDAANTRQNGENEESRETQITMNSKIRKEIHWTKQSRSLIAHLDVYLTQIQSFLNDHVQLLKVAYFFGMFATCLLDSWGLPNDWSHPRVCSFD
jgi:hypothetical protein